MKARVLTVIAILLTSISAFAQKPKWIGNTPVELNYTYKFVEIESRGFDVNGARLDAIHLLALDNELNNAVKVSVDAGKLSTSNTTYDNGKISESGSESYDIKVKVSGMEYKLQANKVDEYWEKRSGMIEMHTLYMVALVDNPVFDRTYLSTSYGAAPVVMSIIPGLGQWYKGSKTKGICMFAAEAAALAGVLVCENQRASYIKKMKEQPKFAKEYNSKASNWETGRNISIGVAAGVWVYNIIDAAVAKGAKRIKIRRADGSGFSMAPFAMPDGGAGVSMAYRF